MLIVTKKMAQETLKKEWKSMEIEVSLDSTQATYENNTLTIKGAKGEVSKILKFPQVYIKVENDKVLVGTNRFTQRQKKIIHTYRALITNMVKGVKEGFEYTLKVVYAKFPMTVEVKGNVFSVKNLLGEKVPRVVKIPEGVQVKVQGQDITVNGVDKELCGQVAGLLEQSTRITHLDRRVIQDGVFITEKPHRKYA